MGISEPYEDSATIGTTEYSCPADSTSLATITDDGLYQFWFDVSAVALGDQFRIRIYEKVRSSGTKRVVDSRDVFGTEGGIITMPSLILLHGWDVTIQKIAGTDRAIEWSIRKVA